MDKNNNNNNTKYNINSQSNEYEILKTQEDYQSINKNSQET